MRNSTLPRPRSFWLLLAFLFILSLEFVTSSAGYAQGTGEATSTSLTPLAQLDFPSDPTSDIPWSGGYSGVVDIQNAFNNARNVENIQLGTNVPSLTLPSQSEWNTFSDTEKALWLINRDRIDRGVMPLHGVETNVTGVAQYYADYLLDNDAWGHQEDGNDPWERLNTNSAINNCHDFLNVAENIAVFVTSGSSIALPVERSVYNWMYDDAGSGWGHRHAMLWYPYNDNSGEPGKEGFIGIGRANGGPYQGPFDNPWNFAEMVVMNVFDPCPSWEYPDESPIITSITPGLGENVGSVNITNLAGGNFSTEGETAVELRKSGESAIVATNVSVVNGSKITCEFNLAGATKGYWDVVVINPDSQVGILPSGFIVSGVLDEFVYLPLITK